MKTMKLLPLLLLLALPAVVQAQFTFTTNNGAITITGYTGSGGAVAIPSMTNGLPVTSIAVRAFNNASFTSVFIPSSVTNIGSDAFENCDSITNFSVELSNPDYSSVSGVLFDKVQAILLQFPAGQMGSYVISNSVTTIGTYAFEDTILTNVTIPNSVITIQDNGFIDAGLSSVTIPNSVTSIGRYAFGWSALSSVIIGNSVTNIGYEAFIETFLTSVTIPKSVTSIGDYAFASCANMTAIYFKGNAPSADATVFNGATNVTVYYLPGTIGWTNPWQGRPAVLWNPQAQTSDGSFGVRTNKFGFNLTGTSNLVIVVEAATNLANPIWSPVQTNTLTGGSSYFSDAQWTNYPGRFYRLRSP